MLVSAVLLVANVPLQISPKLVPFCSYQYDPARRLTHACLLSLANPHFLQGYLWPHVPLRRISAKRCAPLNILPGQLDAYTEFRAVQFVG